MIPYTSHMVGVRPALQKAVRKKFKYERFWIEYDRSHPRSSRLAEAGIEADHCIAHGAYRLPKSASRIAGYYAADVIQAETTVHRYIHSKPPGTVARHGNIDDYIDFIDRYPLIAMTHTLVCFNTMIFDEETDLTRLVEFDPYDGGFQAAIVDRKGRKLCIDDVIIVKLPD